MPETGVYVAVYNYGYSTSDLTDNSGNKISQVLVGPPGSQIPVNVDVDVKLYALVPTVIWVTKWKFLGAQYGAFIAPTFSNANVSAALSTVNGLGINPETSQFSVGDLYVQPLWLGWNRKHFDVAASYAFYAPVGKFDTRTINFPSGPRVLTAPTNVGLGYWTNQLQGNVTWYPSPKRGTAITNTITVEFNRTQRDTDFTNGDFVTWNWGVSQYLPLDKQLKYLAEVALAGYSQWQVTDSSGPTVTAPGSHDRVHGIGFQTGLVQAHSGMQLNFRYMNEFSAANRFRGNSYSLNLAFTLQKPKPPPPSTD